MNLPGTLATIGFGALGYTVGVVHATDALTGAYGLPTEEARATAPVVVDPAIVGALSVGLAAALAARRRGILS